jgi:hypothetical protein
MWEQNLYKKARRHTWTPTDITSASASAKSKTLGQSNKKSSILSSFIYPHQQQLKTPVTMKFFILTSLATLAVAAPVPQVPAGGAMEQSIQGMTNGASNFASDFLKGDMTKVAKDLQDMVGNAAGFPGAFFNDMQKQQGKVN